MTELILKKYFDNQESVETLAADLRNSQSKTGHDTIEVKINQIKESGEFEIVVEHLLTICDSVIKGDLKLIDINTIAYALISSDYFFWDSDSENGESIATILHDWDNPEIRYELSVDNVKLWRDYLLTGDYRLNK